MDFILHNLNYFFWLFGVNMSKYNNKRNIFEDLQSDIENSNCGIYKIKNLKNNKVYIGQSTNIAERWNNHKIELKQNIHSNHHLQHSYNKYGEDSFEFVVLERTFEENLDNAEEYWINFYDSTNSEKGYNIKYGGYTSRNKNEIQEQINLVKHLRKIEAHYFKMRHINNNGGFSRLYELARQNKTQKEASLELDVPQVYIREYLTEQGFSGWNDLIKQARGFKDDYSLIDEKGGVLFIIDELVNGKSISDISKKLNVKNKFINNYLAFKGLDSKEINKYISKWYIELSLKNYGGISYIKKNLKLGLSLGEISEECKVSEIKLSEYLKKYG